MRLPVVGEYVMVAPVELIKTRWHRRKVRERDLHISGAVHFWVSKRATPMGRHNHGTLWKWPESRPFGRPRGVR